MISGAKKENIQHWLSVMNTFNSTPEFGTTRIVFTKPEIENRNYVKSEFYKLGLDVTEDSIGNIFARYSGSEPALSPVWTGSHIDTVPNAGMFDGMSGVVCAMEAIRLMKAQHLIPKRDIVIVAYTSEEPTRYGLGCIGSRAMSGDLTLDKTKVLFDQSGRSLYEKLSSLGYDLTQFDSIQKKTGDVFAAVELHVEQNSCLERDKTSIGIVKKICAPTIFHIELQGVQSHAGGTPMNERRDAFCAASEIALLLEKITSESSSEFQTGTIGMMELIPSAVNVIPGIARFPIDIRDCNMDTKEETISKLKTGIQEICSRRKITATIKLLNHDVPLTCNSKIIKCIEQACHDLEISYEPLISGPFHDSLFVGRFAPTAMIFVPSKDGISHSPLEWTDYEALADGTNVLANTLWSLANKDIL